jgi:tRNA(Ile)-lysidine synthase
MITLIERFRAHVADSRLLQGSGDGGRGSSERTTVVLAVSGGADSLALLDLMHAVAPELGLALVVAHADHGIRPGSEAVAATVRALAGRYGSPCEVGTLALGPGATETAARRARYAWLREVQRSRAARFLATAHHRDDQVETILLRVLRGSAPAGLAGMRPRTAGGLVRPLLPFDRADLARHAAARDLPVHDDPANRDPRHLRSWVRTVLLPLLVERLGHRVADDVLRLGAHAARDRRAWDAVLQLLPGLDLRASGGGFDVARGALVRYDDDVAVEALRAASRRVGLILGPRRALALLALARGQSGHRVELGGGWVAEAAFDRLAVAPGAAAGPAAVEPAGPRGTLRFGPFRVEWCPEAAPARLVRDWWRTWVPAGAWAVRAWAPGDRLAPLQGVGRRAVRRLLAEARVPRRERTGWPVVTRGETILWVPGVCRSDAAVPAAGTEAVRLDVFREDRG